MHLKHIPLKGAYNVRDLGGYPTRDNRCTRWGLLYRSDALSELTEADWQILIHLKVKTIVDLRSLSEATSIRINPPESIAYFNFSLMPDLDNLAPQSNKQSMINMIVGSMKLDHGKTLFDNIHCCADILNTISDRIAAGSVIFLCSAGKDRTGIIAASILYLCDVIREDIIADYIVSSTYNTDGINKRLTTLPDDIMQYVPDPEKLKDSLDSKPETIIKLLDEMDAKDFRAALAAAGFTLKHQRRLKDQFTEPVGVLLGRN